jgi:hypothetical protein
MTYVEAYKEIVAYLESEGYRKQPQAKNMDKASESLKDMGYSLKPSKSNEKYLTDRQTLLVHPFTLEISYITNNDLEIAEAYDKWEKIFADLAGMAEYGGATSDSFSADPQKKVTIAELEFTFGQRD